MSPKRLFCETEPCLEQPLEKTRPRLTFASIIGDVVMVNSQKHLLKALEPLLRRVVNEEVDRCLLRYSRLLPRASSLRIQALEPSSFLLYFVNNLPSTIFTGSKITDVESQPLRIAVEAGADNPASQVYSAMKIEIVVLDGDFASGDKQDWTAEEFNASIVKERSGKRPLLHGEMNITLRDRAATIGDIEFTDNSSWIRSRKFRLGARIVDGSDSDKNRPRIREAITEPFVVKDHRGELYKKHYPPMLHDEVWRLEKIGKEGVFHKKLSNYNIKTVQEFLKLFTVDPQKLRRILGVGMSERMWKATVKHAQTCELGNKVYMFRAHNVLLILNPICEVVRAMIDDQIYSSRDLHNIPQEYLMNLSRQAFDNWHSLQDFEGNFREPPLITQGNEGVENEEDNDHIVKKSLFRSCELMREEVEFRDWNFNPDQFISTSIHYN
ncbi:Protein SAR DEFICIENT 1, partial [Cucurbita argyrosperma subsp. argyrosperma]